MTTKKKDAKVVPIGSGKSAAHEASNAPGEPVFKQELPVKLDDEELLKRGESHAEAKLLHGRLLVERKETVGKLNDKIREADLQCTQLAQVVDSGQENRLVEVQWQFDRPHQCKRLVRLDTNEVVDERPMNEDELHEQLHL